MSADPAQEDRDGQPADPRPHDDNAIHVSQHPLAILPVGEEVNRSRQCAAYAFDLLVGNTRLGGWIAALSAHLVGNDRPAPSGCGTRSPQPGVYRGAPLAHLVVALELLSLLRRSLTGPIDRRLSLGKGQDRVHDGVGVLRQSLVVDVGQVVAELVVAPVERHAGGTAVQCNLVRLLDDLGAGEDPAGRNPGSRESVIV
jgi:hypothetical protein